MEKKMVKNAKIAIFKIKSPINNKIKAGLEVFSKKQTRTYQKTQFSPEILMLEALFKNSCSILSLNFEIFAPKFNFSALSRAFLQRKIEG